MVSYLDERPDRAGYAAADAAEESLK